MHLQHEKLIRRVSDVASHAQSALHGRQTSMLLFRNEGLGPVPESWLAAFVPVGKQKGLRGNLCFCKKILQQSPLCQLF